MYITNIKFSFHRHSVREVVLVGEEMKHKEFSAQGCTAGSGGPGSTRKVILPSPRSCEEARRCGGYPLCSVIPGLGFSPSA